MDQVQGSISRRWVQLVSIPAIAVVMLTSWVANAETTGGAPFSTPDPAPAGYATLVIYRAPGTALVGGDLDFQVNETLVAHLGRHTYTYVYVKEGQTSARFVDASKRTGYARIVAVPGETYFLKWTRSVQIFVLASRTSTGFSFMDPSAAQTELQDPRYHYGYVEPLVRSVSQNAKAPATPASEPTTEAKKDEEKAEVPKPEEKEAEEKK